MIMVMVVETLITMENPLSLVKNQQVNLAITQGGGGGGGGGVNEGSTSHSQHHNVFQGESSRSVPPSRLFWSRDHPFKLIIGDPDVGVRTRNATRNKCLYSGFLSQMEPKKIEEALTDPDWVVAIQEEFNQFEHQKVWKLVPRPKYKKVIDTRWVFRNKLDEEGISNKE